MGCNCRWTEAVLGIIVIVFALWQTTYSKWIVVVAAAILILHSIFCKNCGMCQTHAVPQKSSRKKRR